MDKSTYFSVLSFFIQSPGMYMMRMCGYNNWVYCDGLCASCKYRVQMYTSNKTITSTNGADEYNLTSNTSTFNKY